MEPNFNDPSRRERLRQTRGHNLRQLRTRLRRADDGKVLGVFKGLADSMGWRVGLTRCLGVIALLGLSGIFGVEGFRATLLAWGFFYLLLAALMGPTREAPELDAAATAPGVDWRAASTANAPRADLASLDRQLDSLNRRIRRMESVVTDPAYDWERRLGGK